MHRIPVLSPLHALVFGSTLVEYNLHRIANPKPNATDQPIALKWHWLMLLAGGIMCIAVFWMPARVLYYFAALALLALAYSTPLLPFKYKRRIKDFGIGKIMVLTAVWVFSGLLLPILYWHGSIADFTFERIGRYLFIFCLCLAFDIRDTQEDAGKHINTLPNTIGVPNSYRAIHILLIIYLLLGTWQFAVDHDSRHVIAVAGTAIAAWLAIAYSKRRPSAYAYLGLVDGVMLLYGLLIML